MRWTPNRKKELLYGMMKAFCLQHDLSIPELIEWLKEYLL